MFPTLLIFIFLVHAFYVCILLESNFVPLWYRGLSIPYKIFKTAWRQQWSIFLYVLKYFLNMRVFVLHFVHLHNLYLHIALSYNCILPHHTGQEKSEFWALLGGKTAYTDERILKTVGEAKIPRLFHGSNASGNFKSKFLSPAFFLFRSPSALALLIYCHIFLSHVW